MAGLTARGLHAEYVDEPEAVARLGRPLKAADERENAAQERVRAQPQRDLGAAEMP